MPSNEYINQAQRVAALAGPLGFSLTDVASAVDLPAGVTFDDAIGGRYTLTATDILAISDLFSIPASVVAGQLPAEKHLGVSLRLGVSGAADAPLDALQYAEMLLEHQSLIDSWLGHTPGMRNKIAVSGDQYYKRAGEHTASNIRNALGLGEAPIDDLVSLVERLGYPVAFRDLPPNLHGINVRDERDGRVSRIIVVSTGDPWTRQRFTLAHELCHAVFDDAGQVIVDRAESSDLLEEVRADTFASHLLAPRHAIRAEMANTSRRPVALDQLIPDLMIRWGLSREALIRVLLDEQLVTDPEVVRRLLAVPIPRLMQDAGQLDHWNALCEGQHDQSGSPHLVYRALQAFHAGKIGVTVVADLLGEDVSEVKRRLAESGWS